MTKSPPDERLVYLALKNVFKGADAQVRRPKKVRELIQKAQESVDVEDLIREHNMDNVCNMAKALLEQQIFESTLKAKIRFPEVFEISPAQSAERSASEAEAAKAEADAIRVAAEGQQRIETLEHGHDAPLVDNEQPQPSFLGSTTFSRKRSYPYANPQHQLLVKVQGVLERSCYEFGLRTMRETVEREGWDCPESAELNRWPRIFLSHQDKFRQQDLAELGKPFAPILESIVQLRHTVVHRLRISANRLQQFMVDAESLSRPLQDDCCTRQLTRLRMDTQLSIDELKRNKDLLESNLHSKLRKIAAQRAELDRLADMAVKEMLREDQEYLHLAGANLDQAINCPNTALQGQALTEVEAKSQADLEADLEPVSSRE